ncbi:MAG: DUF2157 domain-containing protein [Bacteroidota bacterium]|nr:DUF2157 domain-containing protein [Bacteroidota bacterium]
MNVTDQLINDGILDQDQAQRINDSERDKPMSVHWELKTILYLGILLFMSGLGILVYQNIDTIGHTVIIGVISIACAASFYYGFIRRKPYSNGEVKYDSPLFDYVVLLGCLLFGVLIGYIQYQYMVFGTHYGIATLFPAALFLGTAYVFDHKGILSLGITGFAASAGISVTPMHLLKNNDFSSNDIIWTSIVVGAVLAGFSKLTDIKDVKKHFGFTYNNFASNILFIALLAGLFNEGYMAFVYFLLIAGLVFYYMRYAIAEKSFLFLLLSVVYGYIALTYSFFSLLIQIGNELSFMLGLFYIVASCAGVVLFFIYYKRILRIKK